MMASLLLAAADDPVVRLTSQARIIAAVLAIAFMALILELIRRHKLQERYSVIWFIAGIAMLAGAAFPDLLRLLAEAFGVRDVTIALFSLLFLLLLGLALSFSVIASRQAEQITRLAQEQALESARGDGSRPLSETRPGAPGGNGEQTSHTGPQASS
jgi:hypothetical protein